MTKAVSSSIYMLSEISGRDYVEKCHSIQVACVFDIEIKIT